MTSELRSMFLSAALAALILPAAAQTPSPTQPAPEPPTAAPTQPGPAQRYDNQQDRIKQGVKSGELTKPEAMQLERQERRLRQEAERLRQKDGGTLTPADRARLEQQQNRLSQQIYKQGHDNQVRPGSPAAKNGNPSPVVNPSPATRMQNQQERIRQGVQDGQLTKGEAQHLEQGEQHIRNEAQQLRQKDGGTLTQADRQRLERQQNIESRRINRARHNGVRRH